MVSPVHLLQWNSSFQSGLVLKGLRGEGEWGCTGGIQSGGGKYVGKSYQVFFSISGCSHESFHWAKRNLITWHIDRMLRISLAFNGNYWRKAFGHHAALSHFWNRFKLPSSCTWPTVFFNNSNRGRKENRCQDRSHLIFTLPSSRPPSAAPHCRRGNWKHFVKAGSGGWSVSRQEKQEAEARRRTEKTLKSPKTTKLPPLKPRTWQFSAWKIALRLLATPACHLNCRTRWLVVAFVSLRLLFFMSFFDRRGKIWSYAVRGHKLLFCFF